MAQGPLLSPREAAERLKVVSEASLQRWRSAGTGPEFVRVGPRKVAYPADGLDRWLAEQRSQRSA